MSTPLIIGLALAALNTIVGLVLEFCRMIDESKDKKRRQHKYKEIDKDNINSRK